MNSNSLLTDFHLGRILLVIAIVGGAHVAVIGVKAIGTRLLSAMPRASFNKVRSLAGLATSFIIFGLYFTALGLVLKEFGVSLKAYLASASVLGLAIGFGSQGLVQDVVNGLTLIFSDLIDLDDMVEISGQTGLVQKIGMRFTVLKNHLGAEVHIPNRTISSVIKYPRGYVRCLVDTTLSSDVEIASRMTQTVNSITTAAFEQFSGIFLTAPLCHLIYGAVPFQRDHSEIRLRRFRRGDRNAGGYGQAYRQSAALVINSPWETESSAPKITNKPCQALKTGLPFQSSISIVILTIC